MHCNILTITLQDQIQGALNFFGGRDVLRRVPKFGGVYELKLGPT